MQSVFTIAYNDRNDIGDDRITEKLLSMGNALTAVVLVDGRIVGIWKRTIKKSGVDVKLSLYRKQSKEVMRMIDTVSDAYQGFLSS